MVQTQTESSVTLLKKQFAQLQAQIQAGTQVTPKVIQVIDKMIEMVKSDIEPAIKQAHISDQEVLNALHESIVSFNSANEGEKKTLLEELASIQTDIGEHNDSAEQWKQKAAAYETSVRLYEKTVKEKTDTCCDKQQAAELAIEYTPSYATCDYATATEGDCSSAATAAVKTAVQSDFAAGFHRYNALNAGCTKLTGDVATTFGDMDQKNTHCDDEQSSCQQRQKALAQKKSLFEADWKKTTEDYATGIAQREGDFTTTETRVRGDEADRKDEWVSCAEILCMLESYVSGGKLDEALMNECKGKTHSKFKGWEAEAAANDSAHLTIVYPTIPPRVVFEKEEYNAMTDTQPFEHICQIEEAAVEDADQNCVKVATPAAPNCSPAAGAGGPVWTLSDAGAKKVNP